MRPLDRLAEQLLVLRAQTGDADALAELVRSHHADLDSFVRSLLRGQADSAVDDVMQDVWLAVIRRIGGLRQPAAFRAWVFQVARRAAFLELRRGKRWLPLVDDVPTASDVRGEELDLTAAQVRGAIDLLAPEHREVLMLRVDGGLDYDEIARVIGRPIGTVRSRLHFARSAVRASLEGGSP